MNEEQRYRPAAWIGFSYFFSLLASTFLTSRYTLYFSILLFLSAVVTGIVVKSYRKRLCVLGFLSAGVAALVFTLASWCFVQPVQAYDGRVCAAQLQITSEPQRQYGRYYYEAKVLSIDGVAPAMPFSVRLSHGEDINARPEDQVACTVTFGQFQERFGLDSASHQLANGNVLYAYISDYQSLQILPQSAGWIRWISDLRTSLQTLLYRHYDAENASVFSAMLLGMRDGITPALQEAYRDSGVTHLLVISGMHMSIFAQFSLSLFLFLRMNRKQAAAASILFLLAFMAVSGFTVTVLRSGIMQILLLLGIVLGRSSDALNALAIAILLICVPNPFAAGDVSLLLSFSATAGVLLLTPKLQGCITDRIQNDTTRRWVTRLVQPVTVSLGAVLGALPVQLYTFGTIQLTSIWVTLLVLFASACALRLCILAVLFLFLPGLQGAALPFLFFSGWLMRYQNAVVRWFSEHIPGKLEISGAYVPFAVLVSCLAALCIYLCMTHHRILLGYVGGAAVLLLAMVLYHTCFVRTPELLVYRSPMATCTAWIEKDKAWVFRCDGNGHAVAEKLKADGVQEIAYLHLGDTEAAIRCAESLAAAFPIETAYGADFVFFPAAQSFFGYAYGYEADVDLPVTVRANGDFLQFSARTCTISIETGSGSVLPADSDLLITDRKGSVVDADFTVFMNHAIIQADPDLLHNGTYYSMQEEDCLRIYIAADGSYTLCTEV